MLEFEVSGFRVGFRALGTWLPKIRELIRVAIRVL